MVPAPSRDRSGFLGGRRAAPLNISSIYGVIVDEGNAFELAPLC